MNLPVELYLALHHLKPRGNFVTLITLISVCGVFIGVTALIVVISIMAGFQNVLRERLMGFNAEITISGGNIADPDTLIGQLKALPEVKSASPYVTGPVLVVHDDSVTPIFLKCLAIDDSIGDDPVFPLKRFVVDGKYELRGDSVLVGKGWAQSNLGLTGDKVQIYGPAQFQGVLHRKKGEPSEATLPEEATIRGVFETDQSFYDDENFLVSLAMAQQLYGFGEAVQGVAVRLKDPNQAYQVRDKLNGMLQRPLLAVTWDERNKDFFSALALERIVMSGILFLVILVAGFGVGNNLITVTVQKSREIGLMKALGATDAQIWLLFTCHGFVVGVVGSSIGVVAALGLLAVRNDIRGPLFNAFNINPSSLGDTIYALPEIPAVINPVQIVVIALSAILVCTFAALIPSAYAARLAPARALRYE